MSQRRIKRNSLRLQSGLNLIEILVAALILSVGLLSMAGLQVASLRSVQNATQKQQAAFIVHELLERMRSNRVAALAGNYNIAVSCAAATAPTDCSGTAACSPSEVATYDLRTLQCGDSDATATRSGVSDQLLEGNLSVTCPAGCNTGVTVTMSWRELLTSDDVADTAAGVAADTQLFNLSVDAVI